MHVLALSKQVRELRQVLAQPFHGQSLGTALIQFKSELFHDLIIERRRGCCIPPKGNTFELEHGHAAHGAYLQERLKSCDSFVSVLHLSCMHYFFCALVMVCNYMILLRKWSG